MRQLFAIFCALVLLPCFTTHAWIGGPFSNNTFFGETGDDGVYEAVAIPGVDNNGNPVNGIGLYRWAVTNAQQGFTEDDIIVVNDDGNVNATVGVFPVTSNVYFGGVGRISHSWFIAGISYTGDCFGTVNSGQGIIACVGNAIEAGDVTSVRNTTNVDRVSSSFQAAFDDLESVPVRGFTGTGTAFFNDAGAAANNFSFEIFALGSRVSSRVIYNGDPGQVAAGG